ncbi:MAG TPA: hypothetical protein VKV19_05045 [Ktedonobacteraceae bacterium]|nr:hypothetical protein [Ktedonobacteraceae bacterium]
MRISLTASLISLETGNCHPEQVYYEMYLTDFQQVFELAERPIILQSKTTEQDLHQFLQAVGCDPASVPLLRQEAEQFRQRFLAQLGWQITP